MSQIQLEVPADQIDGLEHRGCANVSIPLFALESHVLDEKTQGNLRSADEWSKARAWAKSLEALTPYEQAARMIERYPNHPPDAFYHSSAIGRRTAQKARETWLPRLLSVTPDPYFYSLHWYHLPGLSAADADPRKLRCPKTLARWLKALERALKGSATYRKFEVGDEGQLHIHVLADKNALLPDLSRGGEVVKQAYDLDGLIAYLSKPAAPYTIENLAVYLEAGRSGKRRPNLSGPMNVPDKRTYKVPAETGRSSLRVQDAQEAD